MLLLQSINAVLETNAVLGINFIPSAVATWQSLLFCPL